ncbi:MAG: hypothetical protein N2260_03165 [Syntrophobacterales bacterium]|nr:hypothetical protein [Syntrophobacterales bacterium]
MERCCFKSWQIYQLDQAIEIAEDIVSDYFKISASQWRHYRYDIRSLKDLSPEEIIDTAYAQILRYIQHPQERLRGSLRGEYFKICLQDHVILRTLEDFETLLFRPFLIYIVTHELIHIVRFAKFIQSFIAGQGEREKEEQRVHEITQELLKRRKISGMEEVLQFFSLHLPIDVLQSHIEEKEG